MAFRTSRVNPGGGVALRWVAFVLAAVIVSVVAIWILSARFDLDTPSVIDDWHAIAASPDEAAVALHLGNPEPQRYRPGWILWNYVQWHTLDGPHGLVGPNVWNVGRALVLVVGLCLVTMLALPPPRSRRSALVIAGLIALPSLLVVTTPAFALDLARFGPQEPLLIGAMGVGGALLVIATQSLLVEPAEIHRVRTAALAVAGSAFWIVGVYQKEASVCVLPFVVCVCVAGRDRLTAWRSIGLGRRVALSSLAAVILVPLVHVAVETVRIAGRGDLVYDTEVDGGRGALRGVRDLIGLIGENLTLLAMLVMLGAVTAVFFAFFVTRTPNWPAVGAMLSGIFAMFFAGQAGVVVSRYYMPILALFAVAFSIALGSFGPRTRIVGLVAVLVVALPYAVVGRDRIGNWATVEQEWSEFLGLVTEADATGCPVAVAGFGAEVSEAIPVLVALERPGTRDTCPTKATYLVAGEDEEGVALVNACAPGGMSTLRDWPAGSVYRCDRLATAPVADPALGEVTPEQLIARRELDSRRRGTTPWQPSG
jgi:hypothetical protein